MMLSRTFTVIYFADSTSAHARQNQRIQYDELKNIAKIEHSKHKSLNNFIANASSAIAAYYFFEKKPTIDIKFINDGQLALFKIYIELTY